MDAAFVKVAGQEVIIPLEGLTPEARENVLKSPNLVRVGSAPEGDYYLPDRPRMSVIKAPDTVLDVSQPIGGPKTGFVDVAGAMARNTPELREGPPGTNLTPLASPEQQTILKAQLLRGSPDASSTSAAPATEAPAAPTASLAEPPPAAAPPAGMGQGPGVGGSAGVGAARSGGGAGVGVGNLTSLRKGLDDAAATKMKANEAQTSYEVEAARQATQNALAVEAEKKEFEAALAKAETARAESVERAQAGYAAAVEHFNKMQQQSPDPDRYWANKSDGQKAAAVIAGALFGASGQGMAWLNRLDSLVRDDVAMQANELQRKTAIAGQTVAMQNNYVAMMRQNGLEGVAAVRAAHVAKLETLGAEMERRIAGMGDERAKAAGLARLAELKDFTMARKVDLEKSITESSIRAQQLALQREEMRLRAAVTLGRGGPGSGRRLDPSSDERTRLSGAISVIPILAEMAGKKATNLLNPLESSVGGPVSAVSRYVPGTEATRYEDMGRLAAQFYGKAMQGNKLSNADMEMFRETVGASAANPAAPERARIALQTVASNINEMLNTQESAGIDVSQERAQVLQALRPYAALLGERPPGAPSGFVPRGSRE